MEQKIFKTPLEQAQADFDSGKITQGQLDDVAIADFENKKLTPVDENYDWKGAGYESKEHYLTNNDALRNLDKFHIEREKEYKANSDKFKNREISLQDWLKINEEIDNKYKQLISKEVGRIK